MVARMHTQTRFTSLLAIVISLSAAMQVAWSASPADSKPERIAADTPRTTVLGNTFVAPAGWTMTVRGAATILEAPEGGSFFVLVDIPVKDAASADDAVKAAWAAYKPDARWPLKVTNADRGPGRLDAAQGRTTTRRRRTRSATSARTSGAPTTPGPSRSTTWRRQSARSAASQVGLIFGKLLPKGYKRESFAGKKAHPLDAARIAELHEVRRDVDASSPACRACRFGLVPGRQASCSPAASACASSASPRRSTRDTQYMIASNTKALTTLMLAKLVDEKKLAWDTPATKAAAVASSSATPTTTSQVLIKHLICACTGMPRQDLEWLLEFKAITPDERA